MHTKNFHEKDPKFTYLRFPIGDHKGLPKQFDLTKTKGVLKFINPLIDFVEDVTEDGHNVLIHCMAGAHRAGTSVCAWLMYKENMTIDKAIALAKSKREVIDPDGDFKDLLNLLAKFGEGLQEKGGKVYKDLRQRVDVKRDLKAIHESIIGLFV